MPSGRRTSPYNGSRWIAWWGASMGGLWAWIRNAFSGAPRDELDPDVREVFLAELDEITVELEALMPNWRQNRGDIEVLQEIRRAFHTLKGSGQTAGAAALGGFCGRMEKLALQLQERRSTPAPEAIASIESAVRLLTHCSKSIRDGRPLPVELRQLDRTAMQLLGK